MKKGTILCALLIQFLMRCLVSNAENVCSNFCSALGMLNSTPGISCSDIYQISKATRGVSGNYWIQNVNGTAEQVYCDMEL